VSLTNRGSDALTLDDIMAALGSYRHQEAREIFALLDENDNGDIRLGELVPTVVEIGTTRRNIYAGMHDVDHALNTFDWIICMILAIGMLFFIRTSVPVVSWVPQIKALRDNLALIVVGGAFIVGRIGHVCLTFEYESHADSTRSFSLAQFSFCSNMLSMLPTMSSCTMQRRLKMWHALSGVYLCYT
jgi:hypothetical protein